MENEKSADPQADKLPTNIWEVILREIEKRFGRRFVVICLIVVAAPPLVWALFLQFKSYELHKAAAASQWAAEYLSAAGSVSMYFRGRADVDIPLNVAGEVYFNTTLISTTACKLSFITKKVVRVTNFDGIPASNPTSHVEEVTTSVVLTDIKYIMVDQDKEEMIYMRQKLKFSPLFSLEPWKITITTGPDPLLTKTTEAYSLRPSESDAIGQRIEISGPTTYSFTALEFPLETEENARSFHQSLSTSIEACSSIKRFDLCDEKTGC